MSARVAENCKGVSGEDLAEVGAGLKSGLDGFLPTVLGRSFADGSGRGGLEARGRFKVFSPVQMGAKP